jgi:hypothetical protein
MIHFEKRTITSTRITPSNTFKNISDNCGFNIQHNATKNKIIPNVSYKIIVSVIGMFIDLLSPEIIPTIHKPIICIEIKLIETIIDKRIE